MTCGVTMEIGRGFLEVLLEINLEIMELKEFHHLPMFLDVEQARLLGLIMMETFGCLEEIALVIHNIHIVS
jgi:hypothetical protein